MQISLCKLLKQLHTSLGANSKLENDNTEKCLFGQKLEAISKILQIYLQDQTNPYECWRKSKRNMYGSQNFSLSKNALLAQPL